MVCTINWTGYLLFRCCCCLCVNNFHHFTLFEPVASESVGAAHSDMSGTVCCVLKYANEEQKTKNTSNGWGGARLCVCVCFDCAPYFRPPTPPTPLLEKWEIFLPPLLLRGNATVCTFLWRALTGTTTAILVLQFPCKSSRPALFPGLVRTSHTLSGFNELLASTFTFAKKRLPPRKPTRKIKMVTYAL